MKKTKLTHLQIIGIIIFTILVILPQLATAGFFFKDLGKHNLWLACIGGIIGGLLISPKIKPYFIIRSISGLITGIGVSLCTQLYFALFVTNIRQTILKIEIIIPLIIGALPGILLYLNLKKFSSNCK